jgi:hypothetical protein
MRKKQTPTATDERERVAGALERRVERYGHLASPTTVKQWLAEAQLIRVGELDPNGEVYRPQDGPPSPAWLAEHARTGALLAEAMGEDPICPLFGNGPTCAVQGCEEARP